MDTFDLIAENNKLREDLSVEENRREAGISRLLAILNSKKEEIIQLSEENEALHTEINDLTDDLVEARQEARDWEDESWRAESENGRAIDALIADLGSEWTNSFDLVRRAEELVNSEDSELKTMAKITLRLIEIKKACASY